MRDGYKKEQRQKLLILMNLNEAFCLFKEKNPDIKIGVSKFCDLKPKECVTVGAKGTHSVCVCTSHQNVKLMLSAFPVKAAGEKITYHDLLDKLVCSTDQSICMLHRCENCPGSSELESYIYNNMTDEVDNVTFKQWVTTDRSTLVDQTMTRGEYGELLVEKINKLSVHHFIAKNQRAYLKKIKENLALDEVLILLDFAENYSFIVQDAIQGYHWDNSQCTLHPFAIYYKKDGSLKCASVCVVSDCLHHTNPTVYTFISHVIPFVKTLLDDVKKIYYFSDGAASQYKNHKNFTNLMHHMKDFNISAEWHFFATSHGKSPCDGIEGIVKRSVARASLQATTQNQILTPKDLFTWVSTHIHGIHFIWVSKESVLSVSEELNERFSVSKTVPGTRENHSFVPVGQTQLEVSRISGVGGFLVSYDHLSETSSEPSSEGHDTLSIGDLTPGEYVACLYDQLWWIGSVRATYVQEMDAEVQFMHPHGPAKSFFWPKREDICCVPLCHILCKISAPTTATGRRYNVITSDLDIIETMFSTMT